MKSLTEDLIANGIAAAHIGYFLFVVGGFASILVGGVRRWEWIRNPWFRFAHVAAVYVVIIEDVFDIACPLNTIEWKLRSTTNSMTEASTGAGGLLDNLLHHTIPGRILDSMYWSLGVLLIALLFVVPVRFSRSLRPGKKST